jgi:glucans biosynthesis protein
LSSGEEFPYFTSFWLEKPKKGDGSLVIYALLDSPSISGAYRYVITPGVEMGMQVEVRLFPRKQISKLGVAPLTSMYFFGENTVLRPVDYRPEVHDSDGLLINTGTGEWIWRPVQNHRDLMINSFAMNNPRGFGLVQRDRNFDHYQDLEARYDNRPSTWVEPQGAWGEGHVELIQIPSPNEYNDNIVAFWVPETPAKSGDELSFSYRLSWHLYDARRAAGGYVSDTRILPGESKEVYKVILDFHGKTLEDLSAETKVEAVIDVGKNCKLLEHQIHKNEVTLGWRLVFKVRQLDTQPMELRASLKRGPDYLSETWSYSILP